MMNFRKWLGTTTISFQRRTPSLPQFCNKYLIFLFFFGDALTHPTTLLLLVQSFLPFGIQETEGERRVEGNWRKQAVAQFTDLVPEAPDLVGLTGGPSAEFSFSLSFAALPSPVQSKSLNCLLNHYSPLRRFHSAVPCGHKIISNQVPIWSKQKNQVI